MAKTPNLDDMIRDALSAEEAELFERLGDPSVPEMALDVFRGRSAWMLFLIVPFGALFMVLGVYSAWRFYLGTEVVPMLRSGALAAFSFTTVWAMKVWYWMEMQRHAVGREIKRLELQVAQLAAGLRNGGN